MDKEEYCSFCKNRCPLSAPKCSMMQSPEMRQKRLEAQKKAESTCKMCSRACDISNPGCSLGSLMAGIRSRGDSNE